MDLSQKLLSDITIFQKYAKFVPALGRRENWEEICNRNSSMHIRKYPTLEEEIRCVYDEFIIPRKILPSMRSMQFGGKPIELNPARGYNCAYLAVDDPAAFWETMFLLLGGTGVGYSVQRQHVAQLPVVQGPTTKTRRFLIGDSIEGWADSVKMLVRAYFEGRSDPIFDFRDIRPKGAQLITAGGKAPGPDPLRICLDQLRKVLNGAVGRQLTTLEVHDMMCYIADAVLSGGIRRAALISLFSADDLDMMSAKSGAWYEADPQRGRANNSVVLKRGEVSEEQFSAIWQRVKDSGCGEPGFFWTNDLDMGTNPCGEISLKSCQFCNLTEVNVSDVAGQNDLNLRVTRAAFIATLQAGYTDFHYLRPIWKENTEADALIGVGMTGIADGAVLGLDLIEAAGCVKAENERVANLIGINPAARSTTVKPAGTGSMALGCSSGIHARHNDYYIRRMRVMKVEPLYRYLVDNFPEEEYNPRVDLPSGLGDPISLGLLANKIAYEKKPLSVLEDDYFKPHLEAVLAIPQKSPEGSIIRTEPAFNLLERVKRFNQEWIYEGYRHGANHNNVSCTISIREDEWDGVRQWMWENRKYYTGISVLPYDNGTYIQAPFTDCTKEEYEELMAKLHDINLDDVIEYSDNTTLSDQAACAGGACELK